MRAIDYLPLQNGCAADLLKYQQLAGRAVYMSEHAGNPNNAWCASFTGVQGGNNKGNAYPSVRAIAALSGEEIKEGWLEAYFDCTTKKKNAQNCAEYRASDWEADLWQLVAEVESRTYTPGRSICFCVTWPKLREIFAADFRDRIVQHWICLRLTPIIEERFVEQGSVSHSCRKGHGTTAAAKALRRDIIDVSEVYSKEAWVCKIDVRSFFMSIDTDILWRLLEAFIKEHYKGADIDTLLYLSEVTVKHRPQDNCRRKGDLSLWDKLPAHKSLFSNPPGKGMAIGNITSQLLANFYMSYYVARILPMVHAADGRLEGYVDDWAAVFPRKEDCLRFRDESRRILKDVLDLELHPDKFYLQEVRKGVTFVGKVLKPGRTYVANRTTGGLTRSLMKLETHCAKMVTNGANSADLETLQHLVSSVNSYLGFFVRTASYRLRRKLFAKHCKEFYKVCYVKDFAVVHIKNNYNYRLFLTQHI